MGKELNSLIGNFSLRCCASYICKLTVSPKAPGKYFFSWQINVVWRRSRAAVHCRTKGYCGVASPKAGNRRSLPRSALAEARLFQIMSGFSERALSSSRAPKFQRMGQGSERCEDGDG